MKSILLFSSLVLSSVINRSGVAAEGNGREGGEKEQARSFTRKLYDERDGWTTAQFDWTVRILRHKKHPQLEKCSYKYSAWYDFENGRYRVDLESDCPAEKALCRRSRFAYDSGKYLIVDRESLVGKERDGLGQEYMRDPKSLTVFLLSTDVRLLGVFPARFALLKNYSLESILAIFDQSKDHRVSEERVDGTRLTRVDFKHYTTDNCTVSFWLDPSIGNMPVRIMTDAEHLKTETRTAWRLIQDDENHQNGVWVPKEVHSRRWIDEELVLHEECQIHNAIFNRRPPDEVFTWEAMELPDGFIVKHYVKGKKKTFKQWDAKENTFVEWKPTLRFPALSRPWESTELDPSNASSQRPDFAE